MRMRSLIPAQQLGSVAGRYQGLLRPHRERSSQGSPARRRGRGGAVRVAGQAAAGAANGADASRSHRAPASDSVFKPVGSTRDDRMARLEAVLFVAKVPLHARKLGQYANLADGTEARTLMHRLNQKYDQAGRAFRVVEVAGGWQLRTRRQFAGWLRRLPHVPKQVRLSAPAMETLAVIAYRQPVVRADVEAVRGVACGEIIRQLMDRDLVRVAGRNEELGRPFIYSTTKRFLEVFGLRDLDELPRAQWIKQEASETVAIVEGENERGEGAVTLTATKHERSSEPSLTEQQTTKDLPGQMGSPDEALKPNPIAEDEAQDDDEYEDDEWDDDEDGEWEDDDDNDDEYEEGEEVEEVEEGEEGEEGDDGEDGEDEWEEVEVDDDDDDDEWEDVEEGDDLDDDEYEYEEVEVDDDDDEYEDDDDDNGKIDDDDDEYEYEEVDDDDDDDDEYEDDEWEEDDDEV